ncbi:energy-coupling factor transporter transmembrane component T [Microbacterium sp. Clip185]|uniref:energy-coupling factor transporter transmembrane component T n=1 Tax=Microbacterium sp. Clip185 TaxID=3025663 RepID=UPI00236720FB|nr:energy-coupling factor transporter transmembrane component T [Microbacterium sp. Clip185]WDG17917.1 energy-coupling factor transporter transmembrane component T [Microbacterium sp. Clip185]
MTATIDPFAAPTAASGTRFLYALNPLAKFAAIIPPSLALIFVRDLATPLAFLVLAYAVLLVGARASRQVLLTLFLALPAAVVVLGCGFAAWTDAAQVDTTPLVLQIGEWRLFSGALTIGFATALRLIAILALALAAGFTTSGADLARSLVQQLRVPYRIGYTALAAFRFVPRFAHELDVIRQAHRVRGSHGGRGPFAAIARWGGYIVPLLAGAIRHAERVALAMDARAFGAHPDRTERHLVPFGIRDVVFVLAFWAVSAAVFLITRPWALA